MNGVEQINTILKADANVTGKLDTFTIGANTYYAIWNDLLIPQDFDGFKTINFYGSESIDYTLSYGSYNYTFNCRGKDYPSAVNLREAVKDALNREVDGTGDYFFICEGLPVLRPADETDSYNAILNVQTKSRA
jgi:hypothetical protein